MTFDVTTKGSLKAQKMVNIFEQHSTFKLRLFTVSFNVLAHGTAQQRHSLSVHGDPNIPMTRFRVILSLLQMSETQELCRLPIIL